MSLWVGERCISGLGPAPLWHPNEMPASSCRRTLLRRATALLRCLTSPGGAPQPPRLLDRLPPPWRSRTEDTPGANVTQNLYWHPPRDTPLEFKTRDDNLTLLLQPPLLGYIAVRLPGWQKSARSVVRRAGGPAENAA